MMTIIKFTVILVTVFLVVLSYHACHGVPSIDPDGSITWEPLPSLGFFDVDPDQYRGDGNRPATLADMSRGWVNLLQPKGFPIDYAVHLTEVLTGDQELNVTDEVLLGMKNFIGIIICFLFGILFFILLPWIALFFFFCRCCGNCGGKREQVESSLCCKQIGLSFCLLASLGVLCAGAVYIDFSNNFMSRAKDVSFQTSLDALGDLQTFTDGSQRQLSHILEVEYEYVLDVAYADLSNAGKLIAEPVETYLLEDVQVQALFNAFNKLIYDVNDTRSTLQDVDEDRRGLMFAAEFVTDTLQTYVDTLDGINTTCAGCVPPNNGLTVNVNFTQLPILDDQINGSITAMEDILHLYKQGKKALAQIAIDIDSVAEDPISDIEAVIDSASDTIAEIYQNAEDQLNNILDTLVEYKEFMEERIKITDDYEMYRDYGMLTLSLLCFLIFGIFFIGLIFGALCAKDVDPRFRSSGSNCCGNFLMFGVVLTFLVTPLLMLLTSGFFVSLAPVTLTCKPLKNLRLINETIDQPGVISDGYWLGDLILDNSSIPLTITSILEGCDRNASIYSTLQLHNIINIDDLAKIIPELRNQTDKLLDEIDVDDLDLTDLVPDNLRVILQHAVDGMKLQQIDFDTFETLLQEDLVTDNLVVYATALEAAADDNPDVADDLNKVAFDLRQFQQSTVWVVETNMAETLILVGQIQSLIPQLDMDVNNTAAAGVVVEAGLTDTQSLEDALDASVESYINVIIDYFDQYVGVATEQMEDELGRCYPIRAIYDAAINVICHYDLDSLNTVWFSLGWCTVWMIISLIFATKLSKYLRIMDTVIKPRHKYHNNDDMFGRQGSYINRTNARTDTIRRPEDDDSNYDNQAYHDSRHGSNRTDVQEMAAVSPSAPHRDHANEPANSHHVLQDNPDGPQPPSYHEAISGQQHQQQWEHQQDWGQQKWL